MLNAQKTRLREIAKDLGDVCIIEVAHGIIGDKIQSDLQKEINSLLLSVLGTNDLPNCTVHEIHTALQPDS